MSFLESWWLATWGVLIEAGWWLIAGFGVAGLLHAFVPSSWLKRQLGSGRTGVVKAALIGAPMPLCSCSVIPAAASLRRSGASRGASAAFAVSTPEVDGPSVAVTWGMLGPVMAVTRPVAAVLSAIAAGLAIDAWPGRRDKASGEDAGGSAPAKASCCSAKSVSLNLSAPTEPPCCATKAAHAAKFEAKAGCCGGGGASPATRPGFAARLGRAFGYGYASLPRMLAGWIVVGIVLSGLVAAAVPEGWIERSLAGGMGTAGQMLVMLVVGVPLYVCATASTPLAAALVAKGLAPGAAVVFMLAGPATNPATMGWALKDLGARGLLIYLACISVGALAAGAVVQWAFPASWLESVRAIAAEAMLHDHAHASTLGAIGGVGLSALLVVGLARSFAGRFGRSVSGAGEPAPA